MLPRENDLSFALTSALKVRPLEPHWGFMDCQSDPWFSFVTSGRKCHQLSMMKFKFAVSPNLPKTKMFGFGKY